LFVAEIFSFSVTAFAFGFGFIPRFARASFFIVLCWLIFPVVLTSAFSVISTEHSLIFSGELVSILSGVFSGALAGFLVSASAWATIFFASWVNGIIFPTETEGVLAGNGSYCRTSLYTFIGLLFCYSFFESDAGTSLVSSFFELIHRSSHSDQILFFNQGMSLVFYLSILLAGPLFVASLLVDLLLVLLERFASQAANESLIFALRFPVLLLGLTVFIQVALQGFVSGGWRY